MLNSKMFTEREISEEQIKIIYSSVITTAYYLNAQVRTLYELKLLKGDINKIINVCKHQSILAESIIEKQMEIGYNKKLFDSCIRLDSINDSLRELYFDYQKNNKIKVNTLKFDFGNNHEE